MARPSWPGSSGRWCCRSTPAFACTSRHTRRTSTARPETQAQSYRPWCRTSELRLRRLTADRKSRPIGPRIPARSSGCLLLRWVGRDSQPRARLSKGLESPADQLGPAIRKLLPNLSFNGANGAKGELEARTVAAVAQLERGNAERNSQVERPGHLQVAVVRPACDRGQHRAAVLPGLDEEAPEAPLQGDARRVRAKERVSPPTARIRGEGCEDSGPRRGNRYIQCHVHDREVRAHVFCIRFHLPAEPKKARRPARGVCVDPALVHPLQRHRVEIVPAFTASLAARDEACAGQDLKVAHDRDPRDFELGGDFAGDPRPLAQEVQDPAAGRIGKGKPHGAATYLDLSRRIGHGPSRTCNANITYLAQAVQGDR